MTQFIVAFAVQTIFAASCLWVGMQIARVEGKFLDMLVIAAISWFFQSIPAAGFLISPSEMLFMLGIIGKLIGATVMFVLICQWTDADFWPDKVVMVIIAHLAGSFGSFFLRLLIPISI